MRGSDLIDILYGILSQISHAAEEITVRSAIYHFPVVCDILGFGIALSRFIHYSVKRLDRLSFFIIKIVSVIFLVKIRHLPVDKIIIGCIDHIRV